MGNINYYITPADASLVFWKRNIRNMPSKLQNLWVSDSSTKGIIDNFRALHVKCKVHTRVQSGGGGGDIACSSVPWCLNSMGE